MVRTPDCTKRGVTALSDDGHVAIVTGSNHGIGAATARHLAQRGAAVLTTFLRVVDEPDPGIPQAYRDARRTDAEDVVAAIRDAGGRADAIEVDLANASSATTLFDRTENTFGPVDVLVHNATGWVADTGAVRRHGERRAPTRDGHGLGHRRSPAGRRAPIRPDPRRVTR